ncbi:hypothetical protein BSKO_08247 [Bryopsis sp. KO-2023]|nr:hypothetical protein BSKO_08247 [Bryopsis sp. KO-2023]
MPAPGKLRRKSQDLGLSIGRSAKMPEPLAALLREGGGGFCQATRRIQTEADLDAVLQSKAIADFLGFLLSCNKAVVGKKLSDPCVVSEHVTKLLEGLEKMSQWVDEIPPAQHSLRYGNPAYRTWFEKLESEGRGIVDSILPENLKTATIELFPYFLDSFGNKTRIDYGTGHETTFCGFLYCLGKLQVLKEEDLPAVVLKVFNGYLELMRKIQTTYWLEPAGSHGVWGLEDYQFLPFLWGAAQLIDHPIVFPKSIHNDEILESMSQDYMYLESVKFVKQVKKGPLWETSPYLCDIAGVASWTKVNSGLVKMYQAEVLGKLPIMQHFLFGSLIPFLDEPTP